MKKVETLIEARWVIPVRPHGKIHENFAIAIDSGHVHAVVPQGEARERFEASETVVLNHHVVMPGLVNAHTCSALSLLKSTALTHRPHPLALLAEQDLQFVRTGTELAIAQMLRAGITCFNDVCLFPAESIDATLHAQMRAVFGLIISDKPSVYAGDTDEYFTKGLEIHDRYKHDSRIHFMLAAGSLRHVADETLRRISVIGNELDLPLHVNLHQTQDEIEHSITHHGCRPLARLHRLGMIGPSFVATHALYLEKDEIALLKKYKAKVVHCPQLNMHRGGQICPVGKLIKHGVTVALGSGDPVHAGAVDLLAEARSAVLLSGLTRRRIDSFAALEAATLGGARALGLDHTIGSIRKGKSADLVALRCGGIDGIPVHNVADYVVHSASPRDVDHVWIGGQCVVHKRALTTLDEHALAAKAAQWENKIAAALKQ